MKTKSNDNFEPEILRKYLLFENLTESQLQVFANYISHQVFDAGDVIFMEGEIGDSIYLLVSGSVEIRQAITLGSSDTDYDTREKSILRLNAESFPFFGEMSIFVKSAKRSATVSATTQCQMGIISKSDFLEICADDTAIGYVVMKNIASVISDRLRHCNENVLKLTTAFSLILEK